MATTLATDLPNPHAGVEHDENKADHLDYFDERALDHHAARRQVLQHVHFRALVTRATVNVLGRLLPCTHSLTDKEQRTHEFAPLTTVPGPPPAVVNVCLMALRSANE